MATRTMSRHVDDPKLTGKAKAFFKALDALGPRPDPPEPDGLSYRARSYGGSGHLLIVTHDGSRIMSVFCDEDPHDLIMRARYRCKDPAVRQALWHASFSTSDGVHFDPGDDSYLFLPPLLARFLDEPRPGTIRRHDPTPMLGEITRVLEATYRADNQIGLVNKRNGTGRMLEVDDLLSFLNWFIDKSSGVIRARFDADGNTVEFGVVLADDYNPYD